MGQLAYEASTGREVEAFSTTDSEWAQICAAQKGAFLMPRSAWPAVAKTSIRGLRFFSHYPGYPGTLPAPESYAHTRLKIDIVRALRAQGFTANLEVHGTAPEGDDWVADVLALSADGSRVAFEVQLSSQHLGDFRSRSDRYARSNVRVCWFISEKPVAWRLTKALCYENREYSRLHGHLVGDCKEIVPFAIQLEGKADYPDPLPNVRFGRGPHLQRLTLPQAVTGMMSGRPTWKMPDWTWEPTA